ncbi:glutathione S-transferase family protein [Pelagovum pacificum]|uniref:Glutathione S-transferase family protein n=1 Tax=Pelagovum pacificum TaxID=2588711 RepID=A0A5C5G948_9RHOB|nr:glutathione S-transferase family protein [Pelagovum pacificum]QQA42162.1 glutathione S-transferase family protein [Pelagovum pacificum]TNY31248.1 glutathione S-transferase family protein [Pelagovum pacificum]
MILHDWVLSPNCYKVRLMAALTGQPLEQRAVNFYPGREHLSSEYLALNPAGTLPILQDGDLTLTESGAMLAYLADKADGWMGDGSAATTARIQQWLAFAERLTRTAGVARAIDMLDQGGSLAEAQAAGRTCLRELEEHLTERRIDGGIFLTGDTATIADIACFPHVMLAPDGGLRLDPYPSIRLWTRAVRALPGFVEMPGIHRLHELMPEPEMEQLV